MFKKFYIKCISMKKVENYILLVLLFIITVLYFLVPILVTPDSIEYYEYLDIFYGNVPFSNWNIVRGPSLPAVFYIGTLLFGNSTLGFLSTTYIFFLITILSLHYLLNIIFHKYEIGRWKKFFIRLVVIAFVFFNPILFGYSHALLTEFVAIPLSIISIILSWKWLKVDFFVNQRKYILYTLTFSFLFVFLWFLKQPYFSLVFFPVLVSLVLSIFNNFQLKNVLQRLTTFAICIAVLVLSISIWENALIRSSVDYNNGPNNNHFLSYGIIGGISNLRFDKEFDTSDERNLTEQNFISPEERDIIKSKVSSKNPNFDIILVYSRSGVLIDRIVFSYDGEKFTPTDSLSLYMEILLKYPKVVIESYYSNYLATINVYISSRDLSGIYYPIKQYTMTSHENYTIGLNYLEDSDNFKWITEENFNRVKPLYSSSDINIASHPVVKVVTFSYLLLFKVLFLALPIILFVAICQYLLKKFLKNKKDLHIENLVILMLGSSLLHVLFHVFMGAIIDRYVFVVFPSVILGIALFFFANSPKRIKGAKESNIR